jgi:hypothetical protein
VVLGSYFNTICLNWNPDLFMYKTVLHASWPVTQGPRNDSFTVGANPQFCLNIDKPEAPSGGGCCRSTRASGPGLVG